MTETAQQVGTSHNYSHIFNEGRNGSVIFNDHEDYSTFLRYLKEYITAPIDPSAAKKSFVVQGKTYHGVPHLPKNFHNQIVLVGYSLTHKRFHLVVKQIQDGVIESFVRSLCTRYSIYFNKKYKRTGSLFEGPYKSVTVKQGKQLSLLVRHLHKMHGQSSINQYINGGIPNWLSNNPNINNYSSFLNDYVLTLEDQELLNEVIFKSKNYASDHQNQGNIENSVSQVNMRHNQSNTKQLKTHQRVPELAFASAMFILLFSLGFINVSSQNKNVVETVVANENAVTPIGEVAGLATQSENVNEAPKKYVAVINTDGQFVNVYSDKSITSERIATPRKDDQFEILSKEDGWYEIQLPFYQKGYVESDFIKELEIIIE